MKKRINAAVALLAAGLALTACSDSASDKKSGKKTDKTELNKRTVDAADFELEDFEEEQDALGLRRVAFSEAGNVSGMTYDVKISGSYPEADSPLAENVREWIGSLFNDANHEAEPGADGQVFVDQEGQRLVELSRLDLTDISEYGPSSTSYEFSTEFMPVFNSGSLLTMISQSYSYMGGAHGSTVVTGRSFDTETGAPLDASKIFRRGTEAEVLDLVKNALNEQYFTPDGASGYTSLEEALLIDPAAMELPSSAPYFTENGLTFIYQQYEIAPYASGMPHCTLTFEELKPYLSDTGLRMMHSLNQE